MSNGRELDKPATYLIRVRGELDSKWSDWFSGFTLQPKPDHETWLTGSVADQSALYGILLKLHNLGQVLLSVERQADEESGIR
jgi:hypothetical protein